MHKNEVRNEVFDNCLIQLTCLINDKKNEKLVNFIYHVS